MSYLDVLTAGGFLVLLILGGLVRAGRVRNETSYLLADRGTGLFALTATLVMTEFNTTTLIAFSSVGYFAGWWGLSMPFIFLAGLIFYAFTVARKWKRFNAFSVAELFTRRYGRDLGLIASVWLLLSMVGFSATYVKSLNFIFAPLFPEWNAWQLSGAIVVVILLITLRGGLVAVIHADVISFLAVLVVLPLLLVFAAAGGGAGVGAEAATGVGSSPAAEGTWTNLLLLFERFSAADSMTRLPPSFVASLVVLTCFCYISAAWYGQKIFAAKSERVAFRAVVFAAVLVFVLYGAAVLAVAMLAVGGVELADPQEGLPYVVSRLLPGGLRGLAYAVFFATGATTLAGVWSAMSTMVVGDFLRHDRAAPGEDESAATGTSQSFRRGLMISLGFALGSYVLANTLVDNVLNKMILANVPVAALAFALLAGFYWRGASRIGAYASMIVGFGGATLAFVSLGEAGLYTREWAFVVLPGIFATGLAASLLFPPRGAEASRRDEFFRSMGD